MAAQDMEARGGEEYASVAVQFNNIHCGFMQQLFTGAQSKYF